MKTESVHMPKGLLPKGAVPETREINCLKCRKLFESKGYYYPKSDHWEGGHVCGPCNAVNAGIGEPRYGRILI